MNTPQTDVSSVQNAGIGARLRIERTALNLGVRELGRRVGVSGSLISQIELGRVAPSVKTLYAIASALSLSLDDLLPSTRPGDGAAPSGPPLENRPNPAYSPASVHRANPDEELALDSGVRWEILSISHDPPLEFQKTTYQIGAESCPEGTLMSHGGFEHGVVIEGTLSVTVGAETTHLSVGDAIAFASATPHRLFNSGDARAVAIWAVIGRHL